MVKLQRRQVFKAVSQRDDVFEKGTFLIDLFFETKFLRATRIKRAVKEYNTQLICQQKLLI